MGQFENNREREEKFAPLPGEDTIAYGKRFEKSILGNKAQEPEILRESFYSLRDEYREGPLTQWDLDMLSELLQNIRRRNRTPYDLEILRFVARLSTEDQEALECPSGLLTPVLAYSCETSIKSLLPRYKNYASSKAKISDADLEELNITLASIEQCPGVLAYMNGRLLLKFEELLSQLPKHGLRKYDALLDTVSLMKLKVDSIIDQDGNISKTPESISDEDAMVSATADFDDLYEPWVELPEPTKVRKLWLSIRKLFR